MNDARRLVVVWRVTEACDLDCAYCEYRRSRGGARASVRAEAALALGAALADWQRATGRPVLLSWLGGEPLLWPPLWPVSAALRRDYGLRLSVTTNGTRLADPAARARLVDDFAEVTLSVDGEAAAHDQVRGRAGLHAHLADTVRDLRARITAAGRGPRLRVNTVLLHSNVRGLEALGAELAGWGVDELTFNALGGAADDPFYAVERLQPADLEWLALHFDAIRARLAGHGLAVRGSRRYVQRLEYAARGWRWPVADCAPGDRFMFIDAQGRVAPCRFAASDYGVAVDELRGAADIQALPARWAAARRDHLATACRDCLSPQVAGKFAVEAA